VCYSDATIALPLLTAYALTRHAPREPKRLYRRRAEALQRIRDEYERSSRNEAVQERARHDTHDVTLERSR
jgi:deoxyhypusine synthase